MKNITVYKQLPDPFLSLDFNIRGKNWYLKPHTHSFCQIIFVLKGTLYIKNNNYIKIISEGEMCAFSPNWEHSLLSPDGYSQMGLNICTKNKSNDIVKLIDNNVKNFYKENIALTLHKHISNIETYLSDMSIISKLYFCAEVMTMLAECFESKYFSTVLNPFKIELQKHLVYCIIVK